MKYILAIFISILATDASAYFPSDAALSVVSFTSSHNRGVPFCLSIDDKHPSAAFLALSTKITSGLSSIQKCKFDQKTNSVIHEPTGKRSFFVHLSDFNETSSNAATAKYSTYGGPLAGSWCTVLFVRINGKWQVKSIQVDIIS